VAADDAGIDLADGGKAAAEAMYEGGLVVDSREAVIVCGVANLDGNWGAVRATTDESSGGASFFHQAKRGPDWQPINPTVTSTNPNVWRAFVLITWFIAIGSLIQISYTDSSTVGASAHNDRFTIAISEPAS
jgi:hypothetical protein